MPYHRGVACDIYIGGVKATEYNATLDGRTCTVWVVAEEGQEYGFEINILETGEKHHRLVFLADGQVLISRLVSDPDTTTSELNIVETNEEGAEARDVTTSGVGCLRWALWRLKSIRLSEDQRPAVFSFNPVDALRQEAIQGHAVSHRTELGESYAEEATSYHFDLRDPEDAPYVVFQFHYAAKALLQSRGYIPRSPASEPPAPEVFDNDVLSMSMIELQREVMRLRGELNARQLGD
ncbi:hypothetical protein Dda_8827 [Drechslerella dactyloides]|uniref:DUF7918 domain-containing protein n=1 Tax=Drechslerella dactyloides TaxID=74499 RepID=A0AAD6NFL9_DREDA|nr:hypothetical protein Dda_8827 [Drechslerella dactyloides]